MGVGSNGDLGVGGNGDFYMNGSEGNDVDLGVGIAGNDVDFFYMNVGMGVYGVWDLYVDGGTYYIEPPGLLSRIESPRHAFPKTNR